MSSLTSPQAALYSAVLTAFIIESMKLLQEDLTEPTLKALVTISNQINDSSILPFERAEFTAPKYARIVNALFFTSLSCTLTVALLAVLALQWVANYDMGLNTSSPRKRALQRHMRWDGIQRWNMGGIISSLPLIIFVALILSFVGIAYWIWQVDKAISGIVMGGIIAGFLLYVVTNVISILHIASPFRTSVSKGFFGGIIRRGIASLKVLFINFPCLLWKNRSSWWFIGWYRVRRLWDAAHSESLVHKQNFAKREEIALEEETIARDSLLWLANHLEASPSSREHLLVLLKELMELPPELLMDKSIKNAPWEGIFMVLCAPYSNKRCPDDYMTQELNEAGFVCKALSMISTGIDSPAFRSFYESLKSCDDRPISAYAFLANHRQTRPWFRIDLIKAVEQVCRSISQIGPEYFHFVLLNLHDIWPELVEDDRINILNEVANAWAVPADAIHDGSPIPTISLRSIKLVLELVRGGNTKDSLDEDIDTDRYLAALRQDYAPYQMQDMYRPVNHLHQSIQLQLLAQLARIDIFSPTAYDDFRIPLRFLLSTIGSKPLALDDDKRDSFISIMSTVYKRNEDKVELDEIGDALLTGLRYSHTYSGFPIDIDPLIDLIAAIDEYLMRQTVRSEQEYSQAFYVLRRLVDRRCPNFDQIDSAFRDALIQIRNPCIAWFLSQYCPDEWQFSALTSPEFGNWNDKVEKEMFRMWIDVHTNYVIKAESRIAFLRSILLEGPLSARTAAVELLRKNIYNINNEVRSSSCQLYHWLTDLFM
jgi:hypothetical protein